MNSLVEQGLVYPGGKVVAREIASRLGSVLKGSPLAVQYECSHCGSSYALAISPPSRKVGVAS
jgi:hypothetical protein